MKNNKTEHTKTHWNNFYKQDITLPQSSFCLEVQKNLLPNSFVVDIGCGSGRDTFAFASNGINAVGIDGSEEAIQINQKKAEELHLSSKVSFASVDLLQQRTLQKLFEEFKLQAKDNKEEILLYLRFLFHAIDEKTETVLLETITEAFPKGTKFAAEFRTKEDEQRNKIYDDHYRRFVDTDRFVPDLESKGFTISNFYKGTGLSIYKGEDPFLARVFAVKR